MYALKPNYVTYLCDYAFTFDLKEEIGTTYNLNIAGIFPKPSATWYLGLRHHQREHGVRA